MLGSLRSVVMEDPFHVYKARVWTCHWVVAADRWLQAEISQPQDIFELDAVEIWLPEAVGGDGGDGKKIRIPKALKVLKVKRGQRT